jgi:hypothetical protein
MAVLSWNKRWPPGNTGRASSFDRAHGCRESSLGSEAHSGRIGAVRVSSFRQDRRQIYARVSSPGPNRHMAAVPDAACIEHVGLRLFLCPDGPVPDAAVAIVDQEPRSRSIPGAAFHDLLRGPVRRRMARHCDVENLPVREPDDEEDVKRAIARTSIVACGVSEYAKFGRRSGHPEPLRRDPSPSAHCLGQHPYAVSGQDRGSRS